MYAYVETAFKTPWFKGGNRTYWKLLLLINIKKMKFLITLFGIISLLCVVKAQDYPPNAEPGNCYARCQVPNYNKGEMKVPVYTGNYQEPVKLDSLYFLKEKEHLRYPKKFKVIAKNYSEEEIDTLFHKIVKVKDKNQTIDYEMQTIPYIKSVVMEGTGEWFKILCPSFVTPTVVKKLESILEEAGYIEAHKCEGTSCSTFKEALMNFQKDQDLTPSGMLDKHTLLKLGYRL